MPDGELVTPGDEELAGLGDAEFTGVGDDEELPGVGVITGAVP